MKRLSYLVLTVLSLLLFSCSEKKEESTTQEGMMELDLSSYGLPLIINVPDSTTGKLEVEDAKDGTKKIRVGKSFRVSIFEDTGDITLKKSDLNGDDVKKLKRFIIDEPTTLFYENQITEPEFHFYTIVKVGETTYVVQDLDGEEIYNETAAKMMLESAQNMKAKEAARS